MDAKRSMYLGRAYLAVRYIAGLYQYCHDKLNLLSYIYDGEIHGVCHSEDNERMD